MNLYEIDAAVMACIDGETGEIVDEQKLNDLEMERGRKIENTALWIKNLRAEVKALKDEEAAFKARRQTAENKLDSLERYLSGYLDGQKFKSDKVSIFHRSIESVNVTDIDKVPQELTRVTVEARKDDIKKLLKDGRVVPGAELVTKTSMVIR